MTQTVTDKNKAFCKLLKAYTDGPQRNSYSNNVWGGGGGGHIKSPFQLDTRNTDLDSQITVLSTSSAENNNSE